MAFTQSFSSIKHPGQIHSSYNVDWGVGRSGSNGREDTMLVQAMFRMYYWEITDYDYDLNPPPGETEQIEIDGWYGPATQKYIDYSQRKMFADDPGATLVDGVMDPYRESPWAESKISHTRYALGKLVAKCRNFCESMAKTFRYSCATP